MLTHKGIVCLIVISASWAATLSAHPTVSVVVDSTGNIYYSDLHDVWVIRPDGTKKIAVANVHTHELWLSPEGMLYGEDVANQGDQYKHRIWALNPQGELRDVMPWREGHPTEYADYSFVRDKTGRSYVLLRGEKRVDVYKNDRRVRSISLQEFSGDVHWHLFYNKMIYVGIGSQLIQIDVEKGIHSLMARNLAERSEAFNFVADRHALMGMWHDQDGNIYVSVFSGQKVKRISPCGGVKTVFSAKNSWSVSGGAFDADGAMLILEWSASNQVRIRRVSADGTEEIL